MLKLLFSLLKKPKKQSLIREGDIYSISERAQQRVKFYGKQSLKVEQISKDTVFFTTDKGESDSIPLKVFCIFFLTNELILQKNH